MDQTSLKRAQHPAPSACTFCGGRVQRPFFELSNACLCSLCLGSMSVREMQELMHRSELRGVLHF